MVAVVVLHLEIVKSELKIEGSDQMSQLSASDKARASDLILTDLRRIGKDAQLQPYEIPRMLIIEGQPFTADNHKLTPNLKINRPFLTRSYRAQLLGNSMRCASFLISVSCRVMRIARGFRYLSVS